MPASPACVPACPNLAGISFFGRSNLFGAVGLIFKRCCHDPKPTTTATNPTGPSDWPRPSTIPKPRRSSPRWPRNSGSTPNGSNRRIETCSFLIPSGSGLRRSPFIAPTVSRIERCSSGRADRLSLDDSARYILIPEVSTIRLERFYERLRPLDREVGAQRRLIRPLLERKTAASGLGSRHTSWEMQPEARCGALDVFSRRREAPHQMPPCARQLPVTESSRYPLLERKPNAAARRFSFGEIACIRAHGKSKSNLQNRPKR